MQKHELATNILSSLVTLATSCVVVSIDIRRKVMIRVVAEDTWLVSSMMLHGPPWYHKITEQEIATLFTISVKVEAGPPHKYPFPTHFRVTARSEW